MNLLKMGERNRVLMRSLFAYLIEHKKRLAFAVFSMLVLAAIRGIIVYILGPLIQTIFIDKNYSMLRELYIALPALFLIRFAAEYSNNYTMNYIGQKIVQRIRENLFSHIHALSMEFYWRKRSSDVMSRVINDLNNIQSTVQFIPLYGIRDVMTVLSLTFVLFYINWKLALIGAFILPVTSLALKKLGKKMRRSSKESQELVSDISHKFQESLQGIAVVKAFNYEKRAIEKFSATNDVYFSKMMRYLRATSISGPLMELLGSMILLAVIYAASGYIFSGQLKPAMFFSFIAAFFTAYMPLKNISNLNSKLQMGLASWDRIYQILEEKPVVIESPGAFRPEKIEGEIEFRAVSYKYPTSNDWVLKDISLKIRANEIAAFVGPSGCGKSTIIQLLLRFFDPVSGAILIDGRDLRDYDLKAYRQYVSLVTQDNILFDDTVYNNILVGNQSASHSEVEQAAIAADANAFITQMPNGYQTGIGERGVKVSGGQRQRLAIARAIVRRPRILLLDEATSNLDTASEQAVQNAIENVLGDKTVVMVAHRLSTVRNADKIFVLKNGSIVEQGSHEDLIQAQGEYKKLYSAQS